jgi:Putative collagen-binding domain of a collagenase
MNTVQRLAAAEYFHQNDPYKHHIVLHNPPAFDDILEKNSKYTGVSVQVGKEDYSPVHQNALKWINASKKAGKQWAVAVDESGGAGDGLLTDTEDPKHDNARINGLWGAYMAGSWGCEFYFGYKHPHSDLTCEDYRSRDLFWNQCKHLYDFFEGNNIPITETENHDNLVQKGDYCLANPGKIYVVFLKKGMGTLNLENQSGEYAISWFDPRNGGSLKTNSVKSAHAGKILELKDAPSEANKDWVVLVSKKN